MDQTRTRGWPEGQGKWTKVTPVHQGHWGGRGACPYTSLSPDGPVLHISQDLPLTWQTWIGGSVDSGWQVEAAIGKPWDGPAGPFRRLERHRSRVLKSTDPTLPQVQPLKKSQTAHCPQ